MTAQDKMYRVVVGVDGSPSSRQALRWAVRQAHMTVGTVDAVIAWQYPAATGGYGWAPVGMMDDADYGEILGVHIIGPQATELIAEAVAAMEAEATVEDLTWTIHAHPTLAEAMLDASNSVYGMAINA